MDISIEKAKELLESGVSEAQDLLRNPSGVDDLLIQLEEKLKDVPIAGTDLSQVPLMISMVKSYITREYSEVSPKVIVSLVAAFLYLVKRKDLISDSIPVLGQLDDLAVVTLALKLSEPELNAYKQWRDGIRQAEA